MKVLLAASECVPFIKTGGLADVVGTLPIELAKQGVDVRVILPKYNQISTEYRYHTTHVCDFYMQFGDDSMFCGIDLIELNGVKFYFVDNEDFFFGNYIYGGGVEEGLKFAFFCKAVVEAIQRMDFVPDILQMNDWQTGLIAPILKTQYQWDEKLRNIRTIFSIHNLKYQGLFSFREINAKLGLDPARFNANELEFYGCLSFLKAGLVYSDHILTVSSQYAEEIKTPYFGERMDGLLRARADSLSGIMNGIDTVAYNPAADGFIPAAYDSVNTDGKKICKTELQRETGLSERESVPVVGLISRLTPQKGFDLIERVLSDIMRMDIQIMFLGSGDKRYVDMINWATWRYPGQVASYFGMNEALAHRVYAGSDMFLMPSQFEPCGLSQMIAMRYGSVPVVRETGGLKESVIPYNMYTDEGNGFSFANYNAHEMLFTLERAVRYYYDDKPMWQRMVKRGMETDFGWNVSARKYIELYDRMMGIEAPLPAPELPKAPEKKEAAAKKPAKAAAPAKKETAKKASVKKAAPEKKEEQVKKAAPAVKKTTAKAEKSVKKKTEPVKKPTVKKTEAAKPAAKKPQAKKPESVKTKN